MHKFTHVANINIKIYTITSIKTGEFLVTFIYDCSSLDANDGNHQSPPVKQFSVLRYIYREGISPENNNKIPPNVASPRSLYLRGSRRHRRSWERGCIPPSKCNFRFRGIGNTLVLLRSLSVCNGRSSRQYSCR